MALTFDHVVIGVHDLQQAVADYRALGFTVTSGGTVQGRRVNAFIAFKDGTFLEVIAPGDDPPQTVTGQFKQTLDHGEGTVGYALHSDDLDADLQALRARGVAVDPPGDGRRTRDDGQEVHIRTVMLDGHPVPYIIQDVTPRSLRVSDAEADTTHANGVQGIAGVLLVAPDLPPSALHLRQLLGTAPPNRPKAEQAIFSLAKTVGTSPVTLDLRSLHFFQQDQQVPAQGNDFVGELTARQVDVATQRLDAGHPELPYGMIVASGDRGDAEGLRDTARTHGVVFVLG